MNALQSSPSGETTGSVPDRLDDDASAPVDRPSNVARSSFHVASAIVSLWFTLVVFTSSELPWVAGSIALSFWTLEALRRPFPRFNVWLMRFFRPIAHPSEAHRINSATWYMTALTLLALTHTPILCVIGVAVLGFGDPAASFVGRRFGRVALLRNRTLEGTLAFVVAGTSATTLSLLWVTPRPSLPFAIGLAAAASSAGAIAELLSRRLDDNLTIPLAASTAAATLLVLLGRLPW